MVLAASAAVPASGVAGFGDVPDGAFFTEAVQWMVDNDITTGTGKTCFSPDDPVTRGQAAAFMWRMEGSPPALPHEFLDVTAPWQQGPVAWMAEQKITTGTSATTYSPDDELTRGQLAALLHRLAGEPAAAGHPFGDVFASWQQTPVAWMVAEGITTGTGPSTFAPDATVTRGQLATFFYRYKGEPPVRLDPASPACPWDGSNFFLEFVAELGSADVVVEIDATGRHLAYVEGTEILAVDTLGSTMTAAPADSLEIVKVFDDGDVVLRDLVDGTGWRWDRADGSLDRIAPWMDELSRFVDISGDGTVALFAWTPAGSTLVFVVDLVSETVKEVALPTKPNLALPLLRPIVLSESGGTIAYVDGFKAIRVVDAVTGSATKVGDADDTYTFRPQTFGEEVVGSLDIDQLVRSTGGTLVPIPTPPGVDISSVGGAYFAANAPVVAATDFTVGYTPASAVWNHETGDVLYDLDAASEDSRLAGIAADGRTVAFVSTVQRDSRHGSGAALYVMRFLE